MAFPLTCNPCLPRHNFTKCPGLLLPQIQSPACSYSAFPSLISPPAHPSLSRVRVALWAAGGWAGAESLGSCLSSGSAQQRGGVAPTPPGGPLHRARHTARLAGPWQVGSFSSAQKLWRGQECALLSGIMTLMTHSVLQRVTSSHLNLTTSQ